MPKRRATPLLETDLGPPLRDYLVAQGYTVRSEVKGCDMVAVKGDDLIMIELKLRFDAKLLVQATKRQRVTDSVYVAVPRSAVRGKGRDWWGVRRLCRQLELGLILVALDSPTKRVEIAFHPLPYQRQKRKRARRAVLQEVAGRSADHNTAGSTRRALVTAYRENALHIACCLAKFGPLSPRRLRAMDTGPKTLTIVYSNVYGWFARVERGVYAITAQGKADLKRYPDLVKQYRKKLPRKAPE